MGGGRRLASSPGGFLCAANGDEAIRSRPFASPPSRPQPSLFATAQFCFGSAQSLASAAPSKVRSRTEDLVLSKALWMRGADFFAPQVGVMRALSPHAHPSSGSGGAGGGGEGGGVEEARGGGPSMARTAREWAHFCGTRHGGRWSRRAQLGLTPHATHEERYSKHGSALEQHGL